MRIETVKTTQTRLEEPPSRTPRTCKKQEKIRTNVVFVLLFVKMFWFDIINRCFISCTILILKLYSHANTVSLAELLNCCAGKRVQSYCKAVTKCIANLVFRTRCCTTDNQIFLIDDEEQRTPWTGRDVQVPKPQVQVQVQVLRSQVQVEVQVLETNYQVQPKYPQYRVAHKI